MTEAEKEIIRLLNQILLKLPEQQKPKYETKVELTGVIRGNDLSLILNRDKPNNNEKAETED